MQNSMRNSAKSDMKHIEAGVDTMEEETFGVILLKHKHPTARTTLDMTECMSEKSTFSSFSLYCPHSVCKIIWNTAENHIWITLRRESTLWRNQLLVHVFELQTSNGPPYVGYDYIRVRKIDFFEILIIFTVLSLMQNSMKNGTKSYMKQSGVRVGRMKEETFGIILWSSVIRWPASP